MERLNSDIYEKYKNLKKRKLFDEECSRKRDSDIRNYQSATEDLIEVLKNQNDQLHAEISSMHEQFAECEKLLLEEGQKTKELSNEVGRLQNLLSQKNDVNDIALLRSPKTNHRVRSREKFRTPPKKKQNSCTKESRIQDEEAAIVPYGSCQEEQIVVFSQSAAEDTWPAQEMQQEKGQNDCVFQTLVEFLVGMEFSIDSQTKGLTCSVVHQITGYAFSLTWIRHEDREGELMYHVSSLGTLKGIALDWMKEDMIFSMTMFPIFFERISRVIGQH
ncbi:uncharacterized protein LOC103714676 [Phoenix dactylifera]|uniref:Uncharacterized protein LOC103714676 n=1 Tax=Phoenix dactylifera TaxID=42345 RepID=A0A8B9APN1_PHODC|nr:uncharacterized protein LOC103714676 [Phoenix dactylifera]XP_038988731.1 uncharacterized protein LOC103714676 [Phoenix dactylifera]